MKNFFALFALAFLVACSSDDSEGPSLSSLQIESSDDTRLDIGETRTLSVSGFDASNNPFNITESVVWSISSEHATVNQTGVVTGVSVGDATITATVGTLEASFDISVWDSSAPRTEIYVSDIGTGSNPQYKILKFDESGGNPEVFTRQNLSWPQDLLFLEADEVVLISNLNSGSIGRYNINTGAFLNNFAANIGGPTRMKIGPDNLLYVLQWNGNGKVLRYQLDGTFVDEFTSTGVDQSIGMDWDSSGNLYVSSFNNGANGFVRKFDPSGNDLGRFINSNLLGPTNIWFRSNGDLMVNDWSAGLIARFDSEGNFITNSVTGLSRPEGVALLPDRSFLIGNGGTGSIKMYGSNNAFIKDLVLPGAGSLISPNAVVLRNVN